MDNPDKGETTPVADNSTETKQAESNINNDEEVLDLVTAVADENQDSEVIVVPDELESEAPAVEESEDPTLVTNQDSLEAVKENQEPEILTVEENHDFESTVLCSVADHATRITDHLLQLQQKGFMCDTIIKVNDMEFEVHRIVLMACQSPVIQERLISTDIPSLEEKTIITLDMLDTDNVSDIQCFITGLYNGQLELKPSNVDRLIHLFEVLEMKKEMQVCMDFKSKPQEADVKTSVTQRRNSNIPFKEGEEDGFEVLDEYISGDEDGATDAKKAKVEMVVVSMSPDCSDESNPPFQSSKDKDTRPKNSLRRMAWNKTREILKNCNLPSREKRVERNKIFKETLQKIKQELSITGKTTSEQTKDDKDANAETADKNSGAKEPEKDKKTGSKRKEKETESKKEKNDATKESKNKKRKRTRSEGNKYHCNHCKFSTSVSSVWKYHVSSVCPLIRCEHCNTSFVHRDKFRSHMDRFHPKAKSISDPPSLQRLRRSLNMSPYTVSDHVCEFCGDKFILRELYEYHVRDHQRQLLMNEALAKSENFMSRHETISYNSQTTKMSPQVHNVHQMSLSFASGSPNSSSFSSSYTNRTGNNQEINPLQSNVPMWGQGAQTPAMLMSQMQSRNQRQSSEFSTNQHSLPQMSRNNDSSFQNQNTNNNPMLQYLPGDQKSTSNANQKIERARRRRLKRNEKRRQREIEANANNSKLQCPSCEFASADSTIYNKHQTRLCHNKLVCRFCDYQSYEMKEIDNHKETHKIFCQYCKAIFFEMRHMVTHLENKHSAKSQMGVIPN